jgi:pimeloyl-ACP methyl ester carboxylesterase
MVRYIYLHGFASSPQSAKAQSFRRRFTDRGYDLTIPDLNQGDFSRLSLSRQIQQVSQIILAKDDSVVLLGSSFGGLTAAWLAQQPPLQERIQKLVLLAPAFGFLAQWLPRLEPAQLESWRTTGTIPVYHYSEQRSLPLNYGFVEDLQKYDDTFLQHPIPTLVLHGIHDDVISVEASRHYAASRPWVTLIELSSDHALTNVEPALWQHTCTFLDL